VPTTAAAKAKVVSLPKSAKILVRHGAPHPSGEVEVAPNIGRVHFDNRDRKEYRLRLWRKDTDPNLGIDIFLGPRKTLTIVIKTDDVFFYSLHKINGDIVETGGGGGPIRN
jgi:hypothetical protein